MKSKKLKQVEAEIYASYQSLYRLAVTYVKNPDDAMDIVQETAYRAIRRAAELRSADAIGGWLRRILVNAALDLLRSREREHSSESLPEAGREDRYPDTDVLRALDVLDPRERAVVVLRFFEDRKLQEIAEITEENENTVKTVLYRSLKKLKLELTKEEPHCERTPSGRAKAGP